MSRVTEMDWHAWHDGYDEPGTRLARRLAAVQDQIRVALDAAPLGPLHAVSLCAGQGRDLIGALARHPRGADVTARLVELDPRNAAAARDAAAAAGLPGVEAVTADAALTEQYAGLVPADLVLVCGMFGNMTADDIRRTIGFCTQLCAHGGTVIWTRNRQEPDQVPRICDWFAEDGFALVRVSDPAEGWGVGAHRFTANPVPLERGARMFRFIRRPPALNLSRTGRARAAPYYPGSPGSPARPGPCARSATHAAIWLRELKPSLFMMLATCLAAVVWLIESSAAMALLDRPPATSSAISYSRWVSELGGAAATR
jgi:hypothetical protein